MRLVGAGSAASVALTVTVTGTICPFGGDSVFGDAVMLLITGAVVSRTITVNVPVALVPFGSLAVAVTVVVPIANVLPDGGVTVTGSEAPVELVAVTL